MSPQLWDQTLAVLSREVDEQELNTWIRPLQAVQVEGALTLLAPNLFVQRNVDNAYLARIQQIVNELARNESVHVSTQVGSHSPPPAAAAKREPKRVATPMPYAGGKSSLNEEYNFDSFVEGKSNRLARAVSMQITENPGHAYNPLFVYGSVGLGKTHLMHAIGNRLLANNPSVRVVYLHAEKFVDDMIRALQHNKIESFKKYYRNLECLLIDDIQFLAGKERSQEEFFYTFNALVEERAQIVLSSDRYPNEVDGLEERLKSRFNWGLTVSIDPPELETRVAILQQKSEQQGIPLSSEVAFYIAKHIRSNIRELEGAMRRVIATSNLTGHPVTLEFAAETLRDLVSMADRRVSLANIQKTVADYYELTVKDLNSARRVRTITRPRQLAMALAKELTDHSYPEIGRAFGGRDHTTVLHACRKVAQLLNEDASVKEDYNALKRTLGA